MARAIIIGPRGRATRTFEADLAVTDEYLLGKWRPDGDGGASRIADRHPALDRPIVLLGRGGGGTRLLSAIADELGVLIVPLPWCGGSRSRRRC
jgi:hypothetical protein